MENTGNYHRSYAIDIIKKKKQTVHTFTLYGIQQRWCLCADQITVIASYYNEFENEQLIYDKCVFDNSTMILDYIY